MTEQAATETTTATTKATGPCACQEFEIGETIDSEIEGGEPEQTTETTNCTAQTRRDFAPGHDAKLASLLIKAGVQGLEVRYGRSTGVLVTTDAENAAARYGFGHKVRAGIAKGQAKAQAKAQRAAARSQAKAKGPRTVAVRVAPADLDALVDAVTAEAPEAPRDAAPAVTPDWTEATIKVGRWEYPAIIDADTQVATYKNKAGETLTAEAGKYALVNQA